ncbi:hypothetical protein BJ973_001879 [Actinoplanes tereljensis]|uniref:Uncharacterized protein n=1 Tax=Paractinoplanes tereljensis TaxID=571912 RepID=A0A919NK46_9ACTN|nr:hypothetical protein [Actinoplanes tereljensis]GIF20214.1 hypothetical protein Ate02nite_29440 [Actinoplanes tereljensis]
MIPQLVTVRAGRHRFFVPVVPVALLLSPLLLLAVLGGLIACRVYRISALGALLGVGRLLWALPGARFEIDDGHTAVRVSVR